jgi:hypothetical protein
VSATIAVVPPLLTGLILLAAGVAKVARVDETLETFQHFRLPPLLMKRQLAAAFPVFEIMVAAGLLFAEGYLFLLASTVAEFVMGAYVLLVLRAVTRGDDFDCGCFGAAIKSPVGWPLVWRNLTFFIVSFVGVISASVGFAGIGPTLSSALASDSTAAATALVALAVCVVVVISVSLARHPSSPAAELAPVTLAKVGERVPASEVVTAAGEVYRLEDLAALRPQLLVFVKAGCSSCERVIEALTPFALSMDARLGVIFASSTAPSVFLDSFPDLERFSVFAVASARQVLGATQQPTAFMLGIGGTLIQGAVTGPDRIRALLPEAANVHPVI